MSENPAYWERKHKIDAAHAKEHSALVSALAAEKERSAELQAAIRKHRDQKMDDRCWRDDHELYAVLGEGVPDTALPPRDIFLGNCERYWECRKSNVAYEHPQALLEREKERSAALEAALRLLLSGRAPHDLGALILYKDIDAANAALQNHGGALAEHDERMFRDLTRALREAQNLRTVLTAEKERSAALEAELAAETKMANGVLQSRMEWKQKAKELDGEGGAQPK